MNIALEIGFSFKREISADYRRLDLPEGATVRNAIDELGRRRLILAWHLKI